MDFMWCILPEFDIGLHKNYSIIISAKNNFLIWIKTILTEVKETCKYKTLISFENI